MSRSISQRDPGYQRSVHKRTQCEKLENLAYVFHCLLNFPLDFAAGNWILRAQRTLAKNQLCETLEDARKPLTSSSLPLKVLFDFALVRLV